MRVLLVEDFQGMMQNYKKIIRNYDENIEIITATSFSDLRSKLLSYDFDTAIVDNDLSIWNDYGEHDGIENGKKLCDLLQKTKNFKNIKSCLFLYTALDKIKIANDGNKIDYTVIEKSGERDLIRKFETEILEVMNDIIDIEPPVTLDDFKKYPTSKRIHHYKSVINKDKRPGRFVNKSNRYLWTTDIADDDNKEIACLKPWSEQNINTFAASCYSELDDRINRTNKLPAIFWNYTDPILLREQKECIRDVDFENNFINLFFRVSYSQSIAFHLLQNDQQSIDFHNLTKLIDKTDPLILRETQCEMIDIMSQELENESAIKKKLSAVHISTGYEIVDYFDGNIDYYDVESGIAYVDLVSRINSNRYLKKAFRYKRLTDEGIRFKEEPFSYCVSKFEGTILSHIEPL
jgi:hypothetical protein